MLNHLIEIDQLTKEEISSLIETAKAFKNGQSESSVKGKRVALMFCENSTRTRCSFEVAAQELGMHILNFETANSSLAKGESLKDTIENLYFIGVDAVVIRHGLSGIINNTLNLIKYPISFINAGDGNHAHPTQALLDYFTMIEKIGSVVGKKVAIIGDVKHSRVAKSNIALLNKFDVDINLCAPTFYKPEKSELYPVKWHNDISSAIDGADVVMVLRVQNERHSKGLYPEAFEYKRQYEITTDLLNKYAPNAILMHPGPANRNIEVSSELLDNNVGKTILEQAKNGVFVRMAVLNTLLAKEANYAS